MLHYLLNSSAGCDVVLLSPCDSYQLQADWLAPETAGEQSHRLKNQAPSDPEFDWLPVRGYGVKGEGDWTYVIPITSSAFLLITEGPPYRLMKIKAPADFRIDQRALICGAYGIHLIIPQNPGEWLYRGMPRTGRSLAVPAITPVKRRSQNGLASKPRQILLRTLSRGIRASRECE